MSNIGINRIRCVQLKDGTVLPFKVLKSNAGFYIGTWSDGPYTRESKNYWNTREQAQYALDTGVWLARN